LLPIWDFAAILNVKLTREKRSKMGLLEPEICTQTGVNWHQSAKNHGFEANSPQNPAHEHDKLGESSPVQSTFRIAGDFVHVSTLD
jgi:hypothetical protein